MQPIRPNKPHSIPALIIFFPLICLLLFIPRVAFAQAPVPTGTGDVVITEFGAVGDGRTLNTGAIQRAIDRAHMQGGGRVVVPSGVFRTGSIFLKSSVEFQLDEGAVLLGSNQIDDYPKRETRIEGHFEPWRMALVNAQGLNRVRIGGKGKIDGNGILFWAAFWQRRKENPQCTNLEVERPRLMFIDQCRDVRVEGLTLRDPGFWNIHLYRCRDVLIEGVTIFAPGPGVGPIRAPSSDGIDVDSSQDVVIRKCKISVDDDCIALKGSKGPQADKDTSSPPVENVLIENCEFGDGHGVVTCGSEATIIRNVTVRNCVVSGNNNVVRLKLRSDTPQHYENLLYDTIQVTGKGRIFDVAPWSQFFDLKGQPPPTRVVKNIVVRNVTGSCEGMGRITGNKGDTIRDITLQNIQLALTNEKFEIGEVENFVATNVVLNGKTFKPPVQAQAPTSQRSDP
jgi:polygalacturonase